MAYYTTSFDTIYRILALKSKPLIHHKINGSVNEKSKVHDGNGDYVYRLPEESISKQAQPEGKKKPNIEFSGNLAVVKTRPGYAMGIASDIDSHAPSEILATIAGHDTILVIPRNGVSQEKVIAALSHFI